MKNYLLIIFASLLFLSCADKQDLALFNANKAIAQKAIQSYTSPANFELFKSLIDKNIEHQSPMYGVGIVGYDALLEQANFYMSHFSNVTFVDTLWLPGLHDETFEANGSVRVYGTWKGISNASGKSFSVDSYHHFEIKDNKIIESGDFFDATGMMNAVSPDVEVTELE